MALQYGANILASDMRKILEQNDRQQSGVRSWQQLFGNASLGFQAQSDALRSNYADVIAQAYKSNLAQQNAIVGAGLSRGSTQQMLNANRQDLHNAYRQYIQGYTSDTASAIENYGKEVTGLNEALTERAENFSKLYGSAYNYLSDELAAATMLREDAVSGEAQELNYLSERGLDWLKNDEGNLLSWNEISHQILNSDGSLNKKGVEFFDQMFNAAPQGYLTAEGNNVKSFDEWLADKSADEKDELYGLRDWMISQDVFNYTTKGSNLGTANIMSGRESTDTEAGAYEYFESSDAKHFLNTLDPTLAKTSEYKYLKAKKELDAVAENIADDLENNPNKKFDPIEAVLNTIAVWKERINKPKAEKAWKKYKNDAISKRTDILSQFRSAVGADMYNDFMSKENPYSNEYELLVKELKSSGEYNEDVLNKMQKWYDDFVKRIQDFIRANEWTGEISGY